MATRSSYHHGDLAAALQAHARALVRRDGVHGFSLRAAAREAGVDVASVYRHYRDKEALLRAVARGGFLDLAAAMADERAGVEDATQRLRAVGHAYVRFAVGEPELFRLMFGPFGAGGATPVFEGGRSVAFEELTAPISALVDAGRCALPEPEAALVAWSAVHGFATLVVDGPVSADGLDARVDVVLDVVVAGLRARSDEGGAP